MDEGILADVCWLWDDERKEKRTAAPANENRVRKPWKQTWPWKERRYNKEKSIKELLTRPRQPSEATIGSARVV